MLVNQRRARRREGGFTLVELLITMLIVTIGLLGLAKLQATAVSNTSVARTRALMTYQAESLAGMIRANPGFWVTSGPTANYPWFKVDAAGAMTNFGMTAVTTCLNPSGSATCTPQNLAYDDMMQATTGWGAQYALAFPGARASIICVPVGGGTCGANPTSPHGYDITLTWDQKQVAMNRSTVNTASTTTPVSMVMHVQP
jgi:type IV pilus assembly protein PilV